jgi:hypothetical protein
LKRNLASVVTGLVYAWTGATALLMVIGGAASFQARLGFIQLGGRTASSVALGIGVVGLAGLALLPVHPKLGANAVLLYSGVLGITCGGRLLTDLWMRDMHHMGTMADDWSDEIVLLIAVASGLCGVWAWRRASAAFHSRQ